jgi:hypothetical protein
MLAMMDSHGAGVDMRLQRVLGIWERGQFKSHGEYAPYVRILFKEKNRGIDP